MKINYKRIILISIILSFVIVFSGVVSAADSSSNVVIQGNLTNSQVSQSNLNDENLIGDPYNTRTGLHYTTIQSAINSADTKNGDTINVEPGTYPENVKVTKNLKILSTTPLAAKVYSFYIDSNGSGSTISGFNIIKSYDFGSQVGIALDRATNITIKNNTIVNGITAYVPKNVIITDNTSNGEIHLVAPTSVQIVKNTISYANNGVSQTSGQDTTIKENILKNNINDGIHLMDVFNSQIENNLIQNNSGNGIWINNVANLTIKNNNIIKNDLFGIDFSNGLSASKTGNVKILQNNISDNNNGIGLSEWLNGTTINFNRIVNNSNYALYNSGTDTVNAKYNWWGTNTKSNVDAKIRNTGDSTINYSPWLVLNLTGKPATIKNGESSTITADFTKDSNGTNHDPSSGHIPDGIEIKFTSILGNISNVSTVNGKAITTYTAENPGTAKITVSTENLSLNTQINITDSAGDSTPPTVTNTNPANDAMGVSLNAPVVITFSENIASGSNYSGIYLKNLSSGNTLSISSKTISGNTLTINHTNPLKLNTEYKVYLPSGVIKDTAGNNLVTEYTYTFSTSTGSTGDTTPPTVTSANPVNNAMGVSLNAPVVITFSENIASGSNYSGIYLKNLSSGNTLSISSKTISGNTLTINHTNPLKSNTQYKVYLPAGAIKDTAGNNLATEYSYTFSTSTGSTGDTTPPIVNSTDPTVNAVGVLLTSPVTITFSEDVVAGANYSGIYIKNLSSGNTLSITKSISGNTLTINHTNPLKNNIQYKVYLPAGAIKDTAGNGLAANYTYSLSTVYDSGTFSTYSDQLGGTRNFSYNTYQYSNDIIFIDANVQNPHSNEEKWWSVNFSYKIEKTSSNQVKITFVNPMMVGYMGTDTEIEYGTTTLSAAQYYQNVLRPGMLKYGDVSPGVIDTTLHN